ncbi:hypothetical protein SUGI_0900160 [Cryptomeria japonica]|uniref:RGG repeats nuclear RNA binding protein A n=1 Tax=Cryptomeria japonica TaxID=3369 RepID=UPI0024147F53|nr:RGG repeats nuclear RNA binding protein A [Cryptomeria japonica]GLJ43334.1 hypothetical protein SUGI_0900160 [Cryptomeria japonica]
MATVNPFDLLGDDDNGDLTVVLNAPAVGNEKQGAKKGSGNAPVQKTAVASSKLPSKPLPPAQAVREARSSQTEGSRGRGGSGRGGRGSFGNRDQEFGRGRGGNYNSEWGFNRESYDGYGSRGGFYESNADFPPGRQEDGEVASAERGRGGGRGSGRGGRGGRGFGGGRGVGGDAGDEDNRKRMYERRSGTGRGTEMKREGSGRGNWGTPVEEAFQQLEETTSAEEEKVPTLEKVEKETNKESSPLDEEKKQEEEDKEMTLDEYEKLLEEKRKKLLGGQKVEERKVDATAFESMKQLSLKKKDEDAVFIKVSSEKDKEKKNDAGERDERIRKPMSINEFLKPAEGERYHGGGRGRGRGRGSRGGFTGGFGGGDNDSLQLKAPSIEDPRHFPTLGGK